MAGALGIGLTAFVWIPALHFIDTSQRAHLSASFPSEYSFPPSALLLSVIPFFEGGYRLFSQPQYFGPSNLPEVALYVGILPVVAVLSMLTRPWRRWPPGGERRTWYTVLVVGLVLAIGAGTPLEHVLVHIPFYGKQRDQGRNIVSVDLAACALFAWWIDAGGRRGSQAGAGGDGAGGDGTGPAGTGTGPAGRGRRRRGRPPRQTPPAAPEPAATPRSSKRATARKSSWPSGCWRSSSSSAPGSR